MTCGACAGCAPAPPLTCILRLLLQRLAVVAQQAGGRIDTVPVPLNQRDKGQL